MATITAFKAANPYADLGQPASVSRERERLTQLMKEDLHDAAETGWGSGVSDLREAFEHLAATTAAGRTRIGEPMTGSWGSSTGWVPAARQLSARPTFWMPTKSV